MALAIRAGLARPVQQAYIILEEMSSCHKPYTRATRVQFIGSYAALLNFARTRVMHGAGIGSFAHSARVRKISRGISTLAWEFALEREIIMRGHHVRARARGFDFATASASSALLFRPGG